MRKEFIGFEHTTHDLREQSSTTALLLRRNLLETSKKIHYNRELRFVQLLWFICKHLGFICDLFAIYLQ